MQSSSSLTSLIVFGVILNAPHEWLHERSRRLAFSEDKEFRVNSWTSEKYVNGSSFISYFRQFWHCSDVFGNDLHQYSSNSNLKPRISDRSKDGKPLTCPEFTFVLAINSRESFGSVSSFLQKTCLQSARGNGNRRYRLPNLHPSSLSHQLVDRILKAKSATDLRRSLNKVGCQQVCGTQMKRKKENSQRIRSDSCSVSCTSGIIVFSTGWSGQVWSFGSAFCPHSDHFSENWAL